MEICQRLIVLDSFAELSGTLNSNDVSIEQKLGEEFLVLEALAELWDT